MPGCLVAIQSCHGNVAQLSKLGHIAAAFPFLFFFLMWPLCRPWLSKPLILFFHFLPFLCLSQKIKSYLTFTF